MSIIIDCKGIKIACGSGEVSENLIKIIERGSYENEESRLIPAIIQEGERILEIGSGLGYVSALAMKTGKVQSLIGFEANPLLIPLIQKTWEINDCVGICSNLIVTNTSSGGVVDFYIRKDFWASSLSTEPYGYENIIEIKTVNFQELIDQFKPTMIICDIEGGEDFIFEGVRLEGVNKVFMEIHQNVLGRHGVKRVFDRLSHQNFHYDTWHSSGNVVLFSHLNR